MNNTTRILAACLILFCANILAADKQQSLRIVDGGTDGDERYYTVYCPDGKRATVVKLYEIGKVCTQPSYSDKDICKEWTVDEAAIEACK